MKKLFDLKTLIAIIGITLPIVFFILSKKVKELSFKNVAINELVSKKDISDKSIKVFFDEQRVYNLYSISCVLYNSGDVPITKTDYTNKLIIQFPDSVIILKYSIKENPSTMIILDTILRGNRITLLPDLLNPNESIEFSFYVSSSLTNLLPYTNSRIIGGRVLTLNISEEIKAKTKFSNRAFMKFEGLIFWIAFTYTLLYLIMIFWSVYFNKDYGIESPLGKFISFLFLTIGLFCTLFYLIQTKY